MVSNSRIAEIAALVGDPTRTTMLMALMDGRAFTAGELARAASVTPQTASGHLAQLAAAGLIEAWKQGRHRYHRLASPAVAEMLEGMEQVALLSAPRNAKPIVVGPRERDLRAGRTCYDHLAGRLGCDITDALLTRDHLELAKDGGALTDSGAEFLARLGVDIEGAAARGKRTGRIFCRPCIDWSERRPHVAGALGAALCKHAFARGWIRRRTDTRAVIVTPKGQLELRKAFGVSFG